MSMANIYWGIENYPMVEKIFRQSVEFCSDHEIWKLNVAHTFFMQENKFKEAIRYYEPIVKKALDDVSFLLLDLLLFQSFNSTTTISLSITSHQILSVPAIVLANLCVSYIMTSQNEQAEELMRRIEKEEEAMAMADPDKQSLHLCIVNLVIGTLYCTKGNFEFGISRIIKSLEPYDKKVLIKSHNSHDDHDDSHFVVLFLCESRTQIMTESWFYAKRCFLALIETLAKHMIDMKDATFLEILEFLDAADLYGKDVLTKLKTPMANSQEQNQQERNNVSYEARLLKKMFFKLGD